VENALAGLGRLGIVPVVKIDRAEDAVPLGRALLAGGLACAEITFRTGAAAAAIQNLANTCPELLLGAGTVLTIEQAEAAVRAGAKFIVAPGFDPELVDWCQARDLPVLPGVATATEISAALKKRLRLLKFFPSETLGGTAMLKALSGPFPELKFVPTGGISPTNLAAYLALPCVHACGGSWMVESKLIAGGRFDEIARLAAEACAIVREARPAAT
jgi:2-dehydro-3-deoxyphosphogluconate aldolase / (4S)-4-hydroxy-2-oxoglutarate aldolase